MRGWMSGVPGWETSRPSLAVRFLLPRTVERVHNLRVAKPWKCRLGLHDWEVRENPETHDHYEVCLRCDADRDTRRPSWSPDSGDTGPLGKPGLQ